jgi:hypothetical protein
MLPQVKTNNPQYHLSMCSFLSTGNYAFDIMAKIVYLIYFYGSL